MASNLEKINLLLNVDKLVPGVSCNILYQENL